MYKLLASTAAAVMLLFTSTAATAAEYVVDITNSASDSIVSLFIRPAGAPTWDENMLVNDVIFKGRSRQITLSDYPDSLFDIRLVDSDGNTYTFWRFDAAEGEDIVVTLLDIDVPPTTYIPQQDPSGTSRI